jgi:hypothetical protein
MSIRFSVAIVTAGKKNIPLVTGVTPEQMFHGSDRAVCIDEYEHNIHSISLLRRAYETKHYKSTRGGLFRMCLWIHPGTVQVLFNCIDSNVISHTNLKSTDNKTIRNVISSELKRVSKIPHSRSLRSMY